MNIRTLVAPLVAGVCGLALITLTPRLTECAAGGCVSERRDENDRRAAREGTGNAGQAAQGAGVRTSGRVGAFVSTARGRDHHGDGEEDRCMDDRHDL